MNIGRIDGSILDACMDVECIFVAWSIASLSSLTPRPLPPVPQQQPLVQPAPRPLRRRPRALSFHQSECMCVRECVCVGMTVCMPLYVCVIIVLLLLNRSVREWFKMSVFLVSEHFCVFIKKQRNDRICIGEAHGTTCRFSTIIYEMYGLFVCVVM